MHEDGRERVLDLITLAAGAAAAGELWSEAFSSLWTHTLPPFGMQPLRKMSKNAIQSLLDTEESVHERRWHEYLMIVLLEYRDID